MNGGRPPSFDRDIRHKKHSPFLPSRMKPNAFWNDMISPKHLNYLNGPSPGRLEYHSALPGYKPSETTYELPTH